MIEVETKKNQNVMPKLYDTVQVPAYNVQHQIMDILDNVDLFSDLRNVVFNTEDPFFPYLPPRTWKT